MTSGTATSGTATSGTATSGTANALNTPMDGNDPDTDDRRHAGRGSAAGPVVSLFVRVCSGPVSVGVQGTPESAGRAAANSDGAVLLRRTGFGPGELAAPSAANSTPHSAVGSHSRRFHSCGS